MNETSTPKGTKGLELGTMESLREIHNHILKGKTGGLVDFGRKMHLSTTTMQRRLDQLRSIGAEIVYNKVQCTYEYTNYFEFSFTVVARPKSEQ